LPQKCKNFLLLIFSLRFKSTNNVKVEHPHKLQRLLLRIGLLLQFCSLFYPFDYFFNLFLFLVFVFLLFLLELGTGLLKERQKLIGSLDCFNILIHQYVAHTFQPISQFVLR
jgi:hypothetical protein